MDSQDIQIHGGAPETHFAPAARAGEAEIQAAIAELTENPIIDAAMLSFSGLLAVLNEERQILATNTGLLSRLGVEDGKEILGLRPGEALRCVHAEDHPAGCGTSEFCASCGAAIAMVTSREADHSVEMDCVMTIAHGGCPHDIYLSVRSSPIVLAGRRCFLLFLQDRTAERHRAELERTFFHDISNLIVALQGASELLDPPGLEDRELVSILRKQAMRLADEVKIQRSLAYGGETTYQPVLRTFPLDEIIDEVRGVFDHHPAARNRSLRLARFSPDLVVRADSSLLMRVLVNLLVNAVEATDEGREVLVWIDSGHAEVTISVWNHQAIPAEARHRVFQRHFSTKSGAGRGLGCYTIKLFVERYLGGRVRFSSSEAEGTEFCITIPRDRSESE